MVQQPSPVRFHARTRILRQSFILIAAALCAAFASGQVAVTTYHYDNYRTGWNSEETALTVAAVGSSSFGVLGKVALDDQVDAQPLIVPSVTITTGKFKGTVHSVVYVATENNSVYAIDTNTGQALLKANFGAPVVRPLGCAKNNPDVGINSTPVIDLTSNLLYLVSYTQETTGPAYYVHALALGSLGDVVPPQLVAASQTLNDGSTYNFNAAVQRQRPALLLANGSVYAGFGSFCDFAPTESRGWMLGWQTGTLTPLAGNELMDTQASAPKNFYLTPIWMSGFGPATDDSGNVLFVTGNSESTTYDGFTNLQESVLKVSADLSQVLDLFTPANVDDLDDGDLDFGSGGVMVLPDQPGATPHLAVAAGKIGTMFLMNEDNLGGFSPQGNNVLGTYNIAPCWCGPSYFVDPTDGAARVVSSGANQMEVWKLATSPAPALTRVAASGDLTTRANGFFTSVSSNGTGAAANPIIWAVTRPVRGLTTVSLYAFSPDSGGATMQQLFLGTAGEWVANGTNPNLVPVVANGRVFVASYKELVILGLHK
jgi:outer membrane protein assembly factor BamB